tara:strand:+ start:1157 stop:1273 length:117 start_codon:yes stop_codon:yes gene_type:complete
MVQEKFVEDSPVTYLWLWFVALPATLILAFASWLAEKK